MPTTKARYWLLTIPASTYWMPSTIGKLVWLKGQLEQGASGYLHYQVCCSFNAQLTANQAKSYFPDSCHIEATRSTAAEEYVWKEETSIPDSRFELGAKALKRNSVKDWDQILVSAKCAKFEEIPSDVLIRSYSSLTKIAKDYMKPEGCIKEVLVYWGDTGTGKSKLAWEQAGLDAYPKDPMTKFWDGYQGQENVVIDEFRGGINISHMLRWLDRYPVCIETKGSGSVLRAKKIWITSNKCPSDWYLDLDDGTVQALLRRLKVTHFHVGLNSA